MPRSSVPSAGEPSYPMLLSLAPEEFTPSFRELLGLYGDDLSDDLVLSEFGDFLAVLLQRLRIPEDLVEQCCDALETTMRLRDGATALVADHLVPVLAPPVRARLRPFAGPLLEEALDQVSEP